MFGAAPGTAVGVKPGIKPGKAGCKDPTGTCPPSIAESTFVYGLERLDVGMPCAVGIPGVPNDEITEPGAWDKGGSVGCCRFLAGMLDSGGRGRPAVNFKICSAKAGSVPGGGGGMIPPIRGRGKPGNALVPP